ncbi:sortase [Patescibacteria group bacterium]|nr:sortase [Patescibacteria group bacterium]
MLKVKKKLKIRPETKVKLSDILYKAGVVLLASSFLVFLVTFYPVITAELKYFILEPETEKPVVMNSGAIAEENKKKVIIVKDKKFGLVIPKIGANASVVHEVDPYNPVEYQKALTKGVAHASGTAYPGQIGNVFIFSHSSEDFYRAKMFNSVFYLLHKVDNGDKVYLSHENELYEYTVVEKKYVSKTDVDYLSAESSARQVTLMTCWPPGTTLNRLILVAELISIE